MHFVVGPQLAALPSAGLRRHIGPSSDRAWKFWKIECC
jgi:hypothetical protein